MTIRNDGATPEVLIGAFTAAANPVEVHDTRLVEGRQVMDRVEDGITISPGATVVLESGGEHLMLVGVRGALVQGDEFPLTICFRDAGEVPIRVRVRRKVDAAGTSPLPPVTVGGVTVSFASSPPAQPPTADRRPRLFPTVESNWG
jgi:copper(I)-binding protein